MINDGKYRPDIDGLRAISIIAVLGFHAFPNRITGGFVGVDVFFVISGYLISSILYRNFENKSFSYSDFYSRRVLRIFPALLVMIFATSAFGWLVLFPDEFRQLGKHIASGIGFISNFSLWSEAGYFDSASERKLLSHLWSLGIEEQFYIFWPIILSIFWHKKNGFILLTVFLVLLSFILGQLSLLYSTAASSFYLPYNRIWELMIGAILAYLNLHTDMLRRSSMFFENFRSAIGILIIFLSILIFNATNAFPGWRALAPTLGAFLLISSPRAFLNKFVLGNRLVVYIGLISYPLYLWHWPILAYGHILDLSSRNELLLLVALSFLMAVVTFEFVEKNVRKYRGRNTVAMLVFIAILFLILGVLSFGGLIPTRHNSSELMRVVTAIGDWDYPRGLERTYTNDGVKSYFIEGAGEKGRILFYGDSHMEQYSSRIVKVIKENQGQARGAIFMTRGGCLPIPNVYEDRHTDCTADFKEAFNRMAKSREVDSIVIGASWGRLYPVENGSTFYFLRDGEKLFFNSDSLPYIIKQFEMFLTDLAKTKKVYLVIDNPTGKLFDPKTRFEGSRITGIIRSGSTNGFSAPYNPIDADVREKLIKVARRSGVRIIDTPTHFCEKDVCRTALEDGDPIYKDSHHIRSSYVKKYFDMLDEVLLE